MIHKSGGTHINAGQSYSCTQRLLTATTHILYLNNFCASKLIMSLTRVLYDPFTEFDRLFDDAFNARFRPSTTTEGSASALAQQRDRVFPK